MAEARLSLQVYRFYADYIPAPTAEDPGAMREVHYVEYGPLGASRLSVNVARVDRLNRFPAGPRADNNTGVALARARWGIIGPQYDAWKEGREVPDSGTPLAAWNAVNEKQASVLQMHGIKSVENLAEMSESMLNRIPVPGLRGLRKQAIAFGATKEQAAAARELARLGDENRRLQNEMTELRDTLRTQIDTDVALKTPKRRRRASPAADAAEEAPDDPFDDSADSL